MRRLAILSLVVSSLVCAVLAEAQVRGNITGVVRDASDAVLPGATVTLTSPEMPGGAVTMVTSGQGQYRFTSLDPGTYAMTIVLAGFSTYEESDLFVTVGRTVERNVMLPLATVAETITVTGQSPSVDTRQVGLAQELPEEIVEAIPHVRYGVTSYMTMLPGVTTSNYGSSFSVYVMGSNRTETPMLFDGVMTNHPGTGGTWALSDFDTLQEVNVTTLGASVEYQSAAGGVLNVVTKAGTNRFQFDATAFWTPDALTSKPIKFDCGCPEGETGFTWHNYRDFSVHGGGPIVSDHSWFFTGLTYRGKYATSPGAPPPPAEDRYLSWLLDTNTKVTWQINDRLSFQQTYYQESFMEMLPNFVTLSRPIETLVRSSGNLPHAGSELTAILSDTTVLTVRYGLTNIPDERISFNNDLITPERRDTFTGVRSDNAGAFQSKPRRDEVSAKLNTYLAGERVNQNISFGAQIARNRIFRFSVAPGGVVFFDFDGAPDEAVFTPADIRAAKYNAQGFWAEDEVNIGQKVTLKFGVRFDRMEGISQDAPEVDSSFEKTGATIAGLGPMFTWNTVSPRFGFNIKLTDDGKAVLRGGAGRYYTQIFLSNFESVHPGRAESTLARFDPATGGYTTIVSVTNPRKQISVDSDMKAPYTDQYSIGVNREIARNLAVSATYVHKDARNQIGWRDTGGVYGTSTVFVPETGQELTVFPLLNSTGDRSYLRTNGPGYFSRYDGLILNLTKRYSDRWQAVVGYSYSKAQGLQPSGSRDPNDLTNLTGRLDPHDRPHMFNALGSYEIPRIAVQVSGNLNVVQGAPFGSQVRMRLPQGNRSIYVEAPGSYRYGTESILHFRVTKILFRTATRRMELTAEVRNGLQEKNRRSNRSRILGSPTFGQQGSFPDPRMMMFLGKVFF